MARNYYVVLGVSRDADPHQIKQAYRQLVKRFHPDKGSHPADRFLEVQEAYEKLVDPASRQRHDLDIERQKRSAKRPALEVSRPRRRTPVAQQIQTEPLTPDPVLDLYTELDEFFSGLVPGLFGRGKPSSRKKDLYVELLLDPREASAGGLYPLDIPVQRACAACHGRGMIGLSLCGACRGQGRIVEYHSIQLTVPPGASDGEVQRIPLAELGTPEADLVVLVSVEG